MKTVKLYVGLKIPDTTAITALQALNRMGFDMLKGLKREIYYEFEVSKLADQFAKQIVGVDVLVNANKNSHRLGDPGKELQILVQNREVDTDALLLMLKEQLGFKNLTSIKKGVLWTPSIEGSNQKEVAMQIAQQLLCNPHYQTFFLV